MKKHIFITIVLLFFFSILYGQITTEENPISFGRRITALTRSKNAQKVLPPLDMNAIEIEDKENEANGKPPRFGFSHAVNYNLNNSGEWVTLSNGDKLWRLSISCPGALSINLLYDQFWLPDGAKFFIYTPDHSHSVGAMTSANNKGERDNIQGFATEIMHSDQIILEYYIPNNVSDAGIISIAYVVQGYRNILLDRILERSYGESLPCHVNVNCSGNYKWKMEKNAIALIVMGSGDGASTCTGALINTTANDFRPYFLTADHCLDAAPEAYSNLNWWTFYWHYESPGCTSTDPGLRPFYYSTSGAKVLSYNSVSDFALLELDEDPRDKNRVTPFYLGWDRMEYSTSGGMGVGSVGIHHPKGDIKKISIANRIESHPSRIHWVGGSITLPNTHWDIYFTNGTTEKGSSGSPFINDELRVIGQLHGGYNGCAPVNQYYGKFSVSWDENPNIQRQLKHWLDPYNTGLMTYNGTFECDRSIVINNKTYNSGVNTAEEACRITVSNTTFSNNTTVNLYAQEKIVLNTGTKANAGSLVRFMVKGNADRGRGVVRSLTSTDTINEPDGNEKKSTPSELSIAESTITNTEITIFPNPNSGSFTISTTGQVDIQQVEIINLLGQVIYRVQNFQNSTINIPNGAKGAFFVRITTPTSSIVEKIIVQ